MKTNILYFSFFLLISCNSSFSQILNGDFENILTDSIWNNSMSKADYWGGSRNGYGANITNDAYHGSYAAEVWNWYYYSPGIITNGNQHNPLIAYYPEKGGTPINYNPKSMSGYYKYIYGHNYGIKDSAIIEVFTFKWNINFSKRDTIAYGYLHLDSVSNYSPFKLNINLYGNSSIEPDTLFIKIRSSINGYCDKLSNGNCLYFYVDALKLDSPSDIRNETVNELINIYPNPSYGSFTVGLSCGINSVFLKIYDNIGNLIFNDKINTSVKKYNLNLIPGLYVMVFESNTVVINRKLIIR
jgi:hypothetical protein